MAATKNSPKEEYLPQVTAAPEAITDDELTQRVAILRRFRELLLKQRERFQKYLAALEKQQAVIESGNSEELLAHVELEEQIVTDIFAIQKVIDPMEAMYQAIKPDSASDDVSEIKDSLENLKKEAANRSAKNKNLLSSRMTEIRNEITSLRNNPFNNTPRPLYENDASASLVDISG